MKRFKWSYGALSVLAAATLLISFFIHDVNPIGQITLLIQSVGFAWICGAAFSADM
jgi:hypothetical protein